MTQQNGELSCEFIDSVSTGNTFQTVIQTEENDSSRLPNIRNRNLEPASWFLTPDREHDPNI